MPSLDEGHKQHGGDEEFAHSLRFEEPVRVYHTKRNIAISAVLVVLVVLCIVLGPRVVSAVQGRAPKGSKTNPVKIGVVGVTNPDFVAFKKEAQKAGIYIDLVDFQDYTSNNPAVDSGNLDMNEYQHLLYLANYNVKNHKNLQPIGATATYPMGMYSSKVKTVDEIPEGSQVPIPDDESNQARALSVLVSSHLIVMKHPWTPFSTPADIDTAASKVKVMPVKGAQVPTFLSDPKVYAGVINNDFVADAHLKPTDAIATDASNSKLSRPYINVFVVRAADVHNPTYLKLVDIFHHKNVMDGIMKRSSGAAVLDGNYTAAQLQGYLRDIEAQAKEAGQ